MLYTVTIPVVCDDDAGLHEYLEARGIALGPVSADPLSDDRTLASCDRDALVSYLLTDWPEWVDAITAEDPPCIACGAPESGHDEGCPLS